MKAFIKKHPIASYLVLTFVLSWGIFIPFLALAGDELRVESPINVITSIIIGFAPSVSGLIITAIVEGGLKGSSLLARFKLKNRRSAYGAVLLIMPSYAVLNVLLSDLLATPYKIEVVPFSLVLTLTWGLFSSFGEEFGWRGFMLPRMLKKGGWVRSALLMGAIWAVWHIPMNYLGARSYGDYMLTSILLSGVQLVLDGFIVSELFIIFRGSLKITILYHYTLTAMTIAPSAICQPIEFSYGADFRTNLIGFGIKISIGLIIYLANREKLAEGLTAETTTASARS